MIFLVPLQGQPTLSSLHHANFIAKEANDSVTGNICKTGQQCNRAWPFWSSPKTAKNTNHSTYHVDATAYCLFGQSQRRHYHDQQSALLVMAKKLALQGQAEREKGARKLFEGHPEQHYAAQH